MCEYINDYFEIIEKYGTEELKAVKNRLLFECGRSYTKMTNDDFMRNCTCCGGNWSAMFYTGLKACYPSVYEIVPDTPTTDGTANFVLVCTIMSLCGVAD